MQDALPPMDDLWKGAPAIQQTRYNSTHDLEAVQHGKRPHVLHVAPCPPSNGLTCVSEVTSLGATPGTAGTVCITPGCPQQHIVTSRSYSEKRDRPQAKSFAASPTGRSTHHRHAFECVVGRPLEESR